MWIVFSTNLAQRSKQSMLTSQLYFIASFPDSLVKYTHTYIYIYYHILFASAGDIPMTKSLGQAACAPMTACERLLRNLELRLQWWSMQITIHQDKEGIEVTNFNSKR